jgi:hypothetical protein
MLLELLRRSFARRGKSKPPRTDPYGRGLEEYQRRSYLKALAALREALQAAPSNADAYYLIARCYQKLDDEVQMHAALQAALGVKADHLPTHQLLSSLALPGPDYRHRLAEIHGYLQPRTYLEIGVASGRTVALADADTLVIGIDPKPMPEQPLGRNVTIFSERSSDFFAREGVRAVFKGQAIDLAFIDGMHHFEFALQDFIAIERLSARSSTILIHDTYPLDRVTSHRERTTAFWSGDIWRLVLALKKYRPDLSVHTIATGPSGLTIVRNLNPASNILRELSESIVSEYLNVDYSVIEHSKSDMLNLVVNDWFHLERVLA